MHNLNLLKCNKWFNFIAHKAIDCSNNILLFLLHRMCSTSFDIGELFMELFF